MPKAVNAKEPKTCNADAAKAAPQRCACISATISNEKLENVVRAAEKAGNQQQLLLRMLNPFGKDADEQSTDPVGR